MVIAANRSHLGGSFFLSLVFHLLILLLAALYAAYTPPSSAPEKKRLFVDFIEGVTKSEEGEKTEEPKRLAPVINEAKKETAPKPKAAARAQMPTPTPVARAIEPVERPVEKMEEVRKEELAKPVEVPEKSLPTMNQLIPSYEQITETMTFDSEVLDTEEGEEVSLDTTEFKYASYFSRLRDRIQGVWKYPEAARREGLQGTLRLRFVLDAGGNLIDVQVVKSSGIPILDDAAIKAVRRAVPYDALPPNFGKTLKIVASFEYRLSYYRDR